MLRLLDTFSGIGGFSYAAERIVGGYETVAFVEREPVNGDDGPPLLLEKLQTGGSADTLHL